MPDPSPTLRAKLLSIALRGENLIVRCHRESLRGQLLEHGHRAFFDRIEGYGYRPDGDYISSASTQPPSPSCTTLGRERAVQVIPLVRS